MNRTPLALREVFYRATPCRSRLRRAPSSKKDSDDSMSRSRRGPANTWQDSVHDVFSPSFPEHRNEQKAHKYLKRRTRNSAAWARVPSARSYHIVGRAWGTRIHALLYPSRRSRRAACSGEENPHPMSDGKSNSPRQSARHRGFLHCFRQAPSTPRPGPAAITSSLPSTRIALDALSHTLFVSSRGQLHILNIAIVPLAKRPATYKKCKYKIMAIHI